jgi:P27 family predicted phage terminase small subunit
MGRRGPKPTPTVFDIAHATGDGPTDPPEIVAADPVALEVWHSTLRRLQSLELWHQADAGVVARYSVLSSTWRSALAEVRRSGLTVVAKNGIPYPSPAASMMTKLAPQLLAIETALGFTPRARSRMKAPVPAEPSPLKAFLES